MVRCEGKSFDRGRLGDGKPCNPVVGHKGGSNCRIDTRHADQGIDVARIKLQGTLEKSARLDQVFGGSPSIQASPTLKIQVHRIGMQRALRASGFHRNELRVKRVGEP